MCRLLILGILTAVFVSFCAYGQEPNEVPKSLGPKANSQQPFETESLSKLLSSSVSDKEKGEILNKLFESKDKSAAPYLVRFLAIKGQKAGLYEQTLDLLSKMGDGLAFLVFIEVALEMEHGDRAWEKSLSCVNQLLRGHNDSCHGVMISRTFI